MKQVGHLTPHLFPVEFLALNDLDLGNVFRYHIGDHVSVLRGVAGDFYRDGLVFLYPLVTVLQGIAYHISEK